MCGPFPNELPPGILTSRFFLLPTTTKTVRREDEIANVFYYLPTTEHATVPSMQQNDRMTSEIEICLSIRIVRARIPPVRDYSRARGSATDRPELREDGGEIR